MQKIHRVSAKAVVIRDDSILLIRKADSQGDYFIFPGGGQNHGEGLAETVIREVKEETGFEVTVLDLLFVRDYIAANHEFAADESHFHQVELYFGAELANNEHSEASLPDNGQLGIQWLPLRQIKESRIYPLGIRECLSKRKSEKIYLGDIN
jgi:ADP-ribose pyrophosphatase YjhB (NUDIX family)